MENCPNCKRSFPDHLLAPVGINGKFTTVCPICALAKIREAHEAPDYMFHGETALAMYEEALEFVANVGRESQDIKKEIDNNE